MIIFSRHYLTDCNLRSGVQSYTNNHIIDYNTKEGRSLIIKWHDTIPPEFYDKPVIKMVSNTHRTRETANMLGYHCDLIESSLIKELPLPEYEGESIDVINNNWVMTKEFATIFEAHTQNLLDFWASLNKNENYLIFTHGITIRLLELLINGKKVPKYFPDIFKLKLSCLGKLIVTFDDGLTEVSIKNII